MKDCKILVVVVLYNPDVLRLKKNIEAYSKHVKTVLLWENMPSDVAQPLRLLEGENFVYYNAGANLGISKALNYAWNYARKNDYTHILTMDQDSVFESFEVFLKAALLKMDEENCIIGPIPNCSHIGKGAFVTPPYGHIITSGMFMKVNILNWLGGYNENLFVEAIDVDICYRAISRGIKVYYYDGANLNQTYGDYNVKKVMGHLIYSANYSPWRLFYIFRNHYLIYRHFNRPRKLFKLIINYYYVYLKGIIFVENEKIPKIYAIIKGSLYGCLISLAKNYDFKNR